MLNDESFVDDYLDLILSPLMILEEQILQMLKKWQKTWDFTDFVVRKSLTLFCRTCGLNNFIKIIGEE